MPDDTVIEFDTASRVHIGLAVTDRDRSIDFYRTLLGADPTKVRPGYAKFEISDPPLNLALNESGINGAGTRPASLHYGVQVKSSGAVHAMTERLKQAGLDVRVEERTACCYAVQTKVWATDPDGNPWEVFVVLDADVDQRASAESSCCDDACCSAADL